MESTRSLNQKLVLDNKEFFEQLMRDIASGKRVTIRAKGWSMLPMIWDDRDTLTLAPLRSDSIQVGRILLVRLSSLRFVVHRVVQINGDWLILRGDGNPTQVEKCRRDQVQAELIEIERGGRKLRLGMSLWSCFERYWPSNPLVRRLLLGLYRRLNGIKPSTTKS